MKASPQFLPFLVAVALACGTAAFAQEQPAGKKGPTSKIYLSEVKGAGQIISDGKIYEPKQASAFNAPGTIIETRDQAHQAYVYSNGTGMFVDANSRVEIQQFNQEPFLPDRNSTDAEPSISQSDVFIAHGLVGICTSQFASGTRMVYSTAHASINIRGHRLAIKTSAEETVVYLIEGDVTVQVGGKDLGGQVLQAGEMATIRPGPAGQPATIRVDPIDRETLNSLDDKVTIACNSKKTVSFETIEKSGAGGAGNDTPGEIVPHPTVAQPAPTNLTVSPDRL